MSYCRMLSFTADPDYRYIQSLFEGCMERNEWELANVNFIWNKNRLFLERQTLKESMMKAIKKPVNKQGAAEDDVDQAGKSPQ